MKTFYTADDVARWEEADKGTIPFQLEALRKPGVPLDHRWQRYGHIAGAYESMAMIAIARKQFDEVRSLLRKSLEMQFEQFEIRLAQGKTIDAGHFQAVLLAYATTDKPLISKMVNYYSWQEGVAESVYLGKIVKWLALGDIPTAQVTLSQKRPRMEKMFAAYPDCLQAIANKDEAALQIAIWAASKNWAWRAARYEKGLPYAVCFLQGIGIVRLGEQVMGRGLSVRDEYLPPELMG